MLNKSTTSGVIIFSQVYNLHLWLSAMLQVMLLHFLEQAASDFVKHF
jgi:hypothetical protein